ncbi:unnamed protein product [Schistocephalus solidus]|uniref:Calcyphosin-like protein n=1 Tax=Schistocephalus solidus TaxID=70667 RepID=A0A183TLF9_SCHSO|nr:unnamed protein product [Schistocephalus solidus]
MALTANEQKQFQLESRAKLSKAQTPIEKLRYMCLARGASGINGLGRQFRVMDDDSNRQLSKEEFTKGCNDFGCHLSPDEVDKLFADIDTDKSGCIAFDEFLRALRRRIDLVKKAFSLLDKSGDGVITPADLKGVYNAKSHPKYQNGEWTEQDVFREYLKTFECGSSEVDGKVSFRLFEFLNQPWRLLLG